MYMLSVLAHNRYSFIEITGVTNKSLIDIVREIQHIRWPSLPEWTNFLWALAKCSFVVGVKDGTSTEI